MKKLAWGFVLILALVHYDFWNWSDRSLVFGFMPIGLAYQALISLLAGLAWFLVVRFAWPDRIEAWADEVDGPGTDAAAPAEQSEA